MSRFTEKGGVRLRFIAVLTAAIVVIGGVLAAYSHGSPMKAKPKLTVSVSFVNDPYVGGFDVAQLNISGTDGTYYVRPYNDDLAGWASGSGSGGFESQYMSSYYYQTVVVSGGSATVYVQTDFVNSQASTGIAIYDDLDDDPWTSMSNGESLARDTCRVDPIP